MDVAIKIEVERLTHAFDIRFKDIEEKVFTATNKIAENTMLKNQFDLFHSKQQDFERMFITDYKNDIIHEITSLRRELMDMVSEANHGVSYVKSKMSAIEPLIEEMSNVCAVNG